jgi:hypothetical protein
MPSNWQSANESRAPLSSTGRRPRKRGVGPASRATQQILLGAPSHQVNVQARQLPLMFTVVAQWSEAVCPMVVYFLQHLINFVINTKLLTRVSTRGWCPQYSF